MFIKIENAKLPIVLLILMVMVYLICNYFLDFIGYTSGLFLIIFCSMSLVLNKEKNKIAYILILAFLLIYFSYARLAFVSFYVQDSTYAYKRLTIYDKIDESLDLKDISQVKVYLQELMVDDRSFLINNYKGKSNNLLDIQLEELKDSTRDK